MELFSSLPPKLMGVNTKTLSFVFLCPVLSLGTKCLGSGQSENELTLGILYIGTGGRMRPPRLPSRLMGLSLPGCFDVSTLSC